MVKDREDWHPWFAWRPVWSPRSGWLWLRRIRRRYAFSEFDGPSGYYAGWFAEYRP